MKIERYLKDRQLELLLEEGEVLPKRGGGYSVISVTLLFYLAGALIFFTRESHSIFLILFLLVWFSFVTLIATLFIIILRPSPYFLQLNLVSTGECQWKIRSSRKKEITGVFYASEVRAFYISSLITSDSDDSVSESDSGSALLLEFQLKNGNTIKGRLNITGINRYEEVIDFGRKISRILRINWGSVNGKNLGLVSIRFERATKPDDLSTLIDVFGNHPDPQYNKSKTEKLSLQNT